MKKTALAILAAAVYIVSFNFAASAYVPVYDRDWNRGYFTNALDNAGDDVLQNDSNDGGNCSGTPGNRGAHWNSSSGEYDAIKPATDTADEFITEIKARLTSNRCDPNTANNAKNWDNTGAAFIIQTMIGTSRNRPPTSGEIAEWENRVRLAENAGLIEWKTWVSASPNTYYQISRWDYSSNPNDVAWYNGSGSGYAIIFKNPDGTARYIIRRQCANPLGTPLPLESAWYAAGSTTVSDGVSNTGDTPTSITTRPGDTLTFTHRIKNLGPATSSNWYELHNAHSVEGTYDAQYYNNTSLSGSPLYTRREAGIYHNWNLDGADFPLTTNFSARWTRTDYFPAGNYTFTTATDDGVRLYIDGTLRIDDWTAHGVTQHSTTVNLTAGRHTIVMEYYQGGGGYYAAMWYSYMQGSTKVSTAYDAQYYNNTSLSGSPAVTRTDPEINFRWGTGAPVSGINADNFSVRWTRYAYFPAGTYEFLTRTDDGVRLYVDDVRIINDWNGHPTTANTASRTLTAGIHKIVMEYYEGGGGAEAGLSWYQRIQGGTNGGNTNPGSEKTVTTKTVPVPSNAAPGTRICQSILWDWATSTGGEVMYGGGGGGTADMGGMACAIVEANFTLVPTVGITTSNGTRVVQQGDQVTFTYMVDNTGQSDSGTTNCTLTGTQPSGTPAPPSTNCPRTFAAAGGAVDVATAQSITIGSQPAGSTICRTLSVTPSNASGTPATSGAQCVVVAKTPYVHFMGGDVWAGGGFIQTNGTCTTNAGAKITTSSNVSSNAGSTVEYGAFALSDITRFGSGSKPMHNSSDFAALGRRLTFSNNTTTLGRFGAPQHCINDYSSSYQSAPAISGTVDLNRGSGAWSSSSGLTISGSLPLGSQQVYYVQGNVTINNDIRYTGATTNGYNGASSIPSLVVIATGDIRVAANVTNLDGVFISRGTFYTCYPKPSPPTTSTCSNLLTVNGSVIANTIDLYRTRGADGSTVQSRQLPAEIFNLSPEVFLNSVLNSTANESVTTSFSRELPPRF